MEGVIEEVTEALAEVGEETVWVAQHFQTEDERVEAKFKLRQEVRCDVSAQLRQRHHCGVHVKLRKSGMIKQPIYYNYVLCLTIMGVSAYERHLTSASLTSAMTPTDATKCRTRSPTMMTSRTPVHWASSSSPPLSEKVMLSLSGERCTRSKNRRSLRPSCQDREKTRQIWRKFVGVGK